MNRFFYELNDEEYLVSDGCDIRTKTRRVDGYTVFDRQRGFERPLATCTSHDDAELIVAALNNHKTIKPNAVALVANDDDHTCTNERGGYRCDVCFGRIAS